MGQKQLLLIALGVIIAGAALLAGMNIFQAQAIEANRNGLNSDLTHLSNMAQSYYKKMDLQGGGDNSFVGFQIPQQLRSNENGSYAVLWTRDDRMLMQGIGKEIAEGGFGCQGSSAYIIHQVLVRPDSIRVNIIN